MEKPSITISRINLSASQQRLKANSHLKVFVVNLDGSPLMPCTPAKAKKLLKAKKAKVSKRKPFTIQLLWECENQVQDVVIGIDKGSSITGYCAVANDEILISGYVRHRSHIKTKMEVRKAHRKNRRRRLWYRQRRFLNRASSKRSGRLPVSIKANVDEILRFLKKLPIPLKTVVVEDVQIDIRKLTDPSVQNYQKSNRLHENLRLATLIRDKFSCKNCGAKKTRLEAHHIVYKSQGGKDTIKNLISLCSPCHVKVHEGVLQLKITGVTAFKDQIAQRTMQGKAYLYSEIRKLYNLELRFGYETSARRKGLGLEKDHDIDAAVLVMLGTNKVLYTHKFNFYSVVFRAVKNRRQYFDQPKKGKGRVKFQVNEELEGFKKGDLVLVREKYLKQINSIFSVGRFSFTRGKDKVRTATPKFCRLIESAPSMVFN